MIVCGNRSFSELGKTKNAIEGGREKTSLPGAPHECVRGSESKITHPTSELLDRMLMERCQVRWIAHFEWFG
ncbi:MAG: hypothetical protein QOH35_5733 [Acidobacteriaceae bacterium]|jgi:hypothetical protein|nr:hypothetical protein [Acidobacteriaceae bacterium]